MTFQDLILAFVLGTIAGLYLGDVINRRHQEAHKGCTHREDRP